MQGGQIVGCIETAGQFALGQRVIAALRHVFLARPLQFYRRAGNLFGDQYGLTHIILERTAPAEAAAQHQLVDFALVGRQPGCSQHGGKRGFAVLCAKPDFTTIRRVTGDGVHRFHRRVIQIRIGVDSLDFFGGTTQCGFGITGFVADKSLLCAQTFLEHFANRCA